MKLLTLAVALLVFSGPALVLAGEEHMHKVEMPKEFDTLKKLVGTWEGTTKTGDKEEKVTTVYELTSGGTAITEKLMAGTPMEMVSVYHKDGKSLTLTHYCAAGNAPHMNLKKASDKSMVFEVTKPVGIGSLKDTHMHGLTLTLVDADNIQHEWQNYEKGKPNGTVKFALTRKK
jgi:hypothetical protein